MKIVGLTGRSGCGKSSVSAFFRAQGCACIDADQVSREVLQPGSPCLPRLQNAFGCDIVDKNGVLDRRLLANRAFATPEGTRQLTDITHPEILSRIRAAARQAETDGCALFFVDGAVILGTPFEKECDRLVVVTAPYDRSVARICARDGISAEMARRRLDAQARILTEETLKKFNAIKPISSSPLRGCSPYHSNSAKPDAGTATRARPETSHRKTSSPNVLNTMHLRGCGVSMRSSGACVAFRTM